MMLKGQLTHSNLFSSIKLIQSKYPFKHLRTISCYKSYDLFPSDTSVTGHSDHLLQSSSQYNVNSKRHKSNHAHNHRKLWNKGLSKFTYSKKFLAGGMVDPKLPWTVFTGHKDPIKGNDNKGGNTSSKRLMVLDQVFFDAISDLMTSGEVGSRLAGKGIVITKVRVQQGLIGMQVFWTQTARDLSILTTCSVAENQRKLAKEEQGVADELSTEELLKWATPILRQELASQRVVGCTVPHINFKPDQSFRNSREVEEILVRVGECQDADDVVEDSKEQVQLLEKDRLKVPDCIFAPDFVYQPVIYDSGNLPATVRNKPLSCFTPFAPKGKLQRREPQIPINESPSESSTTSFPIRLRAPQPQHGIVLQKNLFGVNRDRIIAKIQGTISLKKEYAHSNIYFDCAPTLPLPSDEPQSYHPDVEQFKSKMSIQEWAHKYARRTSRKNSEGMHFVMDKLGSDLRRQIQEYESTKYEKFEEELKRIVDEEDDWVD